MNTRFLPVLFCGALLVAACQKPAMTDDAAQKDDTMNDDGIMMDDDAAADDAMMKDDAMENDKPADDAMMDDAPTFSLSAVSVDYAKSSVTFVGKSSIVDHPGAFQKFDVAVRLEAAAPQDLTKASIVATIDITSVKTDSSGVDGHFQRADFFDTAKYPVAAFRSTSITHRSGDTYDIQGQLTMKGVTKPIGMTATITDAGLQASFDINRKEFGIANDTYGQKLLSASVPVTVALRFE